MGQLPKTEFNIPVLILEVSKFNRIIVWHPGSRQEFLTRTRAKTLTEARANLYESPNNKHCIIFNTWHGIERFVRDPLSAEECAIHRDYPEAVAAVKAAAVRRGSAIVVPRQTFLHFDDIPSASKGRWVRAASRRGLKLRDWIVEALDAAAK